MLVDPYLVLWEAVTASTSSFKSVSVSRIEVQKENNVNNEKVNQTNFLIVRLTKFNL
jgi:hypothetical protein